MRAVIINDYGDNTVVSLSEIDRPVPQSDEVLIKIHAAGVNPVDWKIRSGAGQRMGMTLPIYLGSELSGTVVAVGGDVCGFVPGDAVYGIIGCGAFADYAVAKAADMAHKPSRLNFIEAAAVPLGALTAWQAMFDLAELSAGQRLLITSGAGGVGSLAVQLAKAAGAHVTAMASAPKERFVRALGADDFIDYTAQPFDKVARDMDVVFDTVGGEIFGRAFATLKPAGFLVTCVPVRRRQAARRRPCSCAVRAECASIGGDWRFGRGRQTQATDCCRLAAGGRQGGLGTVRGGTNERQNCHRCRTMTCSGLAFCKALVTAASRGPLRSIRRTSKNLCALHFRPRCIPSHKT